MYNYFYCDITNVDAVDALNVIVIVQMYLIAQESDYVSSEQRPSGI